jgi:hypothetical protein
MAPARELIGNKAGRARATVTLEWGRLDNLRSSLLVLGRLCNSFGSPTSWSVAVSLERFGFYAAGPVAD